MSNYLSKESSPYLLQHAGNPVEWYPWCKEAFEKARKEDKPIFLSIGYSTCHWCHVMAHESFEKEETAKLLNQYFISVKVDREERPDIDSVYMTVCQAFTGKGGWPMSIFITADQKPFFAGTYFPPESRYGMIGFPELLLTVAKRWQDNRKALLDTADDISRQINAAKNMQQPSMSDGDIFQEKDAAGKGGSFFPLAQENEVLAERAAKAFAENFDKKYGGFGSAPKFPMPHNLIFLTLYSQIQQDQNIFQSVEKTLDSMRRGGLFDQIGYGFARYSTDACFLVPHFEKMLYDNALLIIAYLVGYKASGNTVFLDTAEKTAEYVLREMTDAEGGFYSAQDADSEGEEGKYYVWDYGEICGILGEESGKGFCDFFGVTRHGNFEGKNILNLLGGQNISDQFLKEMDCLLKYRKKRGHLHLDDKILTSWNSLMICAMALLYRTTGSKEYLGAAKQAEEFIEKNLKEGSILYVSCRNGRHSVPGFLEDYACFGAALLFLYDVTSDIGYRKRAEEILEEAERQFGDENGGYFLYGKKNDSLIVRPKETYDGAMPSGNSVMAYCMVLLYEMTGQELYKKRAERQLAFLSDEAAHYPEGYSLFLTALLRYRHPPKKITVVLAAEDKPEDLLPKLPLYAQLQIYGRETPEYKLLKGKTTYYVCENYTCLPPANEIPKSGFFIG